MEDAMALIETRYTLLKPDPTARGGWARTILAKEEEIPKGIPVISGWTSWDPTDATYRAGVVIRS